MSIGEELQSRIAEISRRVGELDDQIASLEREVTKRMRELEAYAEELDDRIDGHEGVFERINKSLEELRMEVSRLTSRETTCGLVIGRLERLVERAATLQPKAAP